MAVIDSGSHSNVFAAGTDGKLYQTYNPQGTWTPWSRVTNAGVITTAPAAIRLPTGEVDVYASGTDYAIYQIR